MRESVAALALIRHISDGQPVLLTQWNKGWQALNLVGGHRRAGESFQECLCRELAEELGLQAGTDYSVGDRPAAHVEYVAFSRSAGEQTAYTIELFEVQLTPAALARVSRDPQNAWVGDAEIRAGRARDGRPVSETVRSLLQKAGLLPEG
jgi:8-oxo-dGTP pyrophosphatase MutT (NUDIX family)